MIRILHVIGAMGCGGSEAMIMNLYRNIDRTKIQFDFVVHTTEEKMYDNEIKRLGGKIFRTEKYLVSNYISYRKWWLDFFENHKEYKIIHGHIGSSAPVYLDVARKKGLITIAHSHSTKSTRLRIKKYLWEACSYPTRWIADYFFACSREAAIDRFGKRIADSKRCSILKNAIDCDRFIYSDEKRRKKRTELGVQDELIIGHVGRFSPQKNHFFLLNVFKKIYMKNKKARLLLLGEGELEAEIKKRCEELKIDNAVIFAGIHQNTEDYYAAMDVFCFPSCWEGLGIVAVEAQTNGLVCVAADTVPQEADIKAGLFVTKSLEATVEEWADEILLCATKKRMIGAEKFTRDSGYDVKRTAYELAAFYAEVLSGEKYNEDC